MTIFDKGSSFLSLSAFDVLISSSSFNENCSCLGPSPTALFVCGSGCAAAPNALEPLMALPAPLLAALTPLSALPAVLTLVLEFALA